MTPPLRLRPVARAIIHDAAAGKLLLVRNRGADYWYPPGGGWEFERETLVECVRREALEETGLAITVARLLYVQEFRADAKTLYLELFWLARPKGRKRRVDRHKDAHGSVAEARWFSRQDLGPLTVFPERLKAEFWACLDMPGQSTDPFILAT